MIDAVKIGEIKAAFQLLKKNISAVAAHVGVDRRTVNKYVRCGKPVPRRRVKPARKLTQRRKALQALVRETCRKGSRVWQKYSSSSSIRAALKSKTGELLSERHIRRELRQCGLRAFVRPTTPTRTSSDLVKRRAFAKRMRSLSPKALKSIVFSDESWLSCAEKTGRMQWAAKKTEVLPREAKARWNLPSIMVWGCCGYDYKGPLIVFPSKTVDDDGVTKVFRLDATTYVRRCLSKISDDMVKKKRLFQQDGARSHAAKTTIAYLNRKRVNFIRDWPAYSPDLSAVERIWKELLARVGARCPMTTEELTKYAQQEWQKMPQSLINAHCMHFLTQVRDMK